MAEPIRTYYRSIDRDGGLWCESRNPDEVHEQTDLQAIAERGPFTFERLDIYETTEGWQPWTTDP